jgi:type IV pilus assembly protein PilZ
MMMGEAKKKIKARQHPRKTARLKVHHESVLSFRTDETEDISLGGIFIKTERPLPLETQVYLDIELPTGLAPIGVMAEVVWVADQETSLFTGKAAGMGVRFISLSDEERETIASFLSRRRS